MAIQSAMCVSARRDWFRGVHQESDVYMIALYDGSANLNVLTERYTTVGEVQGAGYKPGGLRLEGFMAGVDGVTAIMQWKVDPVWKNATINARGALVYNKSKHDLALGVVDFGKAVVSTNGPWVFPMPPFTASTALFSWS